MNQNLTEALARLGFGRIRKDTFLRDRGAEIQHFVLFDGIRGRGTKVSVAIRHQLVEGTYLSLYPSVAEATPSVMEIIKRGGYAAGIELGIGKIDHLGLDTRFPSWIGADLSLSEAISRMDEVRSTRHLHAWFASEGPYRETWIARTAESWLRYLIVLELEALEGQEPPQSELDRIEEGLKHTTNKPYWSPLTSMGFDRLRHRIRANLEALR